MSNDFYYIYKFFFSGHNLIIKNKDRVLLIGPESFYTKGYLLCVWQLTKDGPENAYE